MKTTDVRQGISCDAWDRLVRERVQEPLRPERLRSLLMIVPAASGDVALSTTVIRHVKQINPDCRITFATRTANLPLARMCPGVEQAIELPYGPSPQKGHQWEALSRQRYLKEFEGCADAVSCPCFFPEDVDLLTQHRLNSLEAIWLLSGVLGGVPPRPQRVWMETTLPRSEAVPVIRRSVGRQAQIVLAKRGVRRFPESLLFIARNRSLKGSGIKVVGRDLSGLRNIREVADPIHQERLNGKAILQSFVLLATEATSLPPPPREVVTALVGMLRQSGRTVLHNVRDPLQAATGTVPLVCSYEEFLCLREAGIPFVGWRSGLCDVAAASQALMSIFCPPEHDWFTNVMAMFGLGAMNIDARCLEVVCRGASDVKNSGFLDYLNQRN